MKILNSVRIAPIVLAALVAGSPVEAQQGNSGNAPGQTGSTPGQSGNTPGQSGSTPNDGAPPPGQAGSTPGQSGGTPGQNGSAPSQPGKPHAQITWLTEAAKIEADLLANGAVTVEFKSGNAVSNVAVWLTPSLQGMSATPATFATLEKDTVYSIRLKLEEKPTRTLGGTLQLRDGGTSNRSYASPLPIVAKVQGGTGSGNAATTVSGVAASTDYRSGRIVPGQTVSLFGQGIGPDQPIGARLDERGRVATVASGVQVLFNGLPAPILMAVRDQINVVAPQGLASDRLADIVVMFEARMSQTVSVPVDERAPALFSLDGAGTGQAAALNQDGSVNGGNARARRGEVITLYGSGFGEFAGSLPDGAVVGSELPRPKAEVSVTIGGTPAKMLYAGGAPGLVAGVIQINVEVPQNVASGDRVAVIIKAGNEESARPVTIAID